MVFCGQCGLQLAPGSTTCPRCGAFIEPDLPEGALDDPHRDDATLPSLRQNLPETQYRYPGNRLTPPHQPQLILGPGSATRQPGPPDPNAPTSPTAARNSGAYPSMPPNTPVYSPLPGQYEPRFPQPSRRQRRGRKVLWIIALLILLLCIAILLITRSTTMKEILGHSVTPTPTPIEQARAVIERYYNDINSQNYRDAYNLWGSAYQKATPYSQFAAGYTHTKHDDITILSLTLLSNGTVKASIIIQATEETASGVVHSTYQGTYTVGQENGTWKFLSGTFCKIRLNC